MPALGKLLYVKDRKTWRAWLAKHHAKEREIWLVYYRAATGQPRIPYNDAVEEALCYGWIDSTVKKLDAERFAQRFSPRRPGSPLSPMNRERVRDLLARRKMTKAGLAAIAHAFDPAREANEKLFIPAEIRRAFHQNPKAWDNFRRFPPRYQRIRIAFVESRRRHGEAFFRRSLENLIRRSAENKRFGFVKEMR